MPQPNQEIDLIMVDRKLVAISLDPEDEDEEIVFCTYNLEGQFQKIRDQDSKFNETDFKSALKRFFQLDLPYIVYHDANPFELLDDECEVLNTRIFKPNDGVLERDTKIGNEIGYKFKKERVERVHDHSYLPGKPDMIYESYPFFKPDIDESYEFANEEFVLKFISKFFKSLFQSKNEIKATESLQYIRDLITFQNPVEYQNYFTIHNGEFYDVFQERIFQTILQIYEKFIFKNSAKLRKFFNDTDSSYHPILNSMDNISLKSIGSVATSPFAFGISDEDTKFLNALLVHVELVNMNLGIGEGYELYFNSKKQNFANQELIGTNSTKIDNFLKYFTKCVSICLNSKTNRFIITDYYWISVFEIEDVKDGEIEDVKRLISKVKVRHFSFSNFEKSGNIDENLTIRSIIASFFNVSPTSYKKNLKEMETLNKKVIKDWELFKKTESHSHVVTKSNNRKRLKFSPFTYSTPTGIQLQKQKVDLEKSLIKFIAIGYEWSCQTLSVDLKKLFQDKLHYSQLNFDKAGANKKGKEVLLSIYDAQYDSDHFEFDEYYRSIESKKSKASFDSILGLVKPDQSYFRWLSNVEVYEKLVGLQGDVIAKIIDYGYLEDKAYNDDELHFKTDGFYMIYEPISPNFQDMTPVDFKNEEHYQLAKETLSKIHEYGVSFHPRTKLTLEILRYYKGKVYVINLEEASSVPTKSSKNKDLIDLDRIFNKSTGNLEGGKERKRSRQHAHGHSHQHIFDFLAACEEDDYRPDYGSWSVSESEEGDEDGVMY